MVEKTPVTLKIFLGYWYHGEIKSHLNQSKRWREAKLFNNQELITSQFQAREYIGNFIESFLPYNQLKEREESLKKQLLLYCPKLNIEKQKIYLFPQIFLS